MNKKNIFAVLLSFVFVLFAAVGNVYALPPKPNMPGGPAVPSQPKLPPCVECDEVFASPTPVATTAPSNGGTTQDNEDNDEDDNDEEEEGEVLGLSATSGADSFSVLTVIGMTWVGVGLKLRNRRS
jgi:hypothetical protein